MPPATCSLYLTDDIEGRRVMGPPSTVIVMAIVGVRMK
jgi:hypothetical protein